MRLVDEVEEGRVLGEQCFQLTKPDARPVFDPRLGEVVCDGVKSAIHSLMIVFGPEWVHGPNGPSFSSVSLTAHEDISDRKSAFRDGVPERR